MNSPSCVPEKVKRIATRSPVPKMSSTTHEKSGKAVAASGRTASFPRSPRLHLAPRGSRSPR
jgi:hypothetical protein